MLVRVVLQELLLLCGQQLDDPLYSVNKTVKTDTARFTQASRLSHRLWQAYEVSLRLKLLKFS